MSNCRYQLNKGPCNQPIVPDSTSYSGWSHARQQTENGEPIDWLHWASPVPYGMGESESVRVFVPCAVCGKQGPDNEKHVMKPDDGGHAFVTKP